MWPAPENDHFSDVLYLAGERVPAGVYRQVGGSREVRLVESDYLPASLDGRVACYRHIRMWSDQAYEKIDGRKVLGAE